MDSDSNYYRLFNTISLNTNTKHKQAFAPARAPLISAEGRKDKVCVLKY